MHYEAFKHGLACLVSQPDDYIGADVVIKFNADFWGLPPADQIKLLWEAREFTVEVTTYLQNNPIVFTQRSPQHKPISKTLKKAVIERDKCTCRYCGKSEIVLTLDHLTPYIQGGESTLENLVVACKSCNSKKHGRTPEQAGMQLLEVPA